MNMRHIVITIVFLALASCANTKTSGSDTAGTREPDIDPIDRLVASYNASYGLWRNGTYPAIYLPSDTKFEQVLHVRE